MRFRTGVLLLRVRDFPRMLAFYRDTLGLPIDPIRPGGTYQPLVDWVKFALEPTALELVAESRSKAPVDLPLPRTNALWLALKVDDIFEAYRELGARGVSFTRPIGEEDWGWYAHFKDPEGNRLQIYQNKPGFE